MADLYTELKKQSGQRCYTLTQDKPGVMHVDAWGVSIDMPSGNTIEITRNMVMEAFPILQSRGIFTVEDSFAGTNNRAKCDRLLAVLRTMPEYMSYSASPRAIHLRKSP